MFVGCVRQNNNNNNIMFVGYNGHNSNANIGGDKSNYYTLIQYFS